MSFGVLVNNLNSTWAFVVLGLLLPAASVTITLLLYRRLLGDSGSESSPSRDRMWLPEQAR